MLGTSGVTARRAFRSSTTQSIALSPALALRWVAQEPRPTSASLRYTQRPPHRFLTFPILLRYFVGVSNLDLNNLLDGCSLKPGQVKSRKYYRNAAPK